MTNKRSTAKRQPRLGRLTSNGWRIGRHAGFLYTGPAVYLATRERATDNARTPVGTTALVRVADGGGRAVRVRRSHMVPPELLGAWRSLHAIWRRCGVGGRKAYNGVNGKTDFYDKLEVEQTWTPGYWAHRWGTGPWSTAAQREALCSFVAHIGLRPHGMTCDRIDGAKGYLLGNVRWATKHLQAANRLRWSWPS